MLRNLSSQGRLFPQLQCPASGLGVDPAGGGALRISSERKRAMNVDPVAIRFDDVLSADWRWLTDGHFFVVMRTARRDSWRPAAGGRYVKVFIPRGKSGMRPLPFFRHFPDSEYGQGFAFGSFGPQASELAYSMAAIATTAGNAECHYSRVLFELVYPMRGKYCKVQVREVRRCIAEAMGYEYGPAAVAGKAVAV